MTGQEPQSPPPWDPQSPKPWDPQSPAPWDVQWPAPWDAQIADPSTPPTGDDGAPPVTPAPEWGDAPTQTAGPAAAYPAAAPYPPGTNPGAAYPPAGAPSGAANPPGPPNPPGAPAWGNGSSPVDWGAYRTGSPYGSGRASGQASGGDVFYGGETAGGPAGWVPTGQYRTGRSNGMAIAGLVLAIIGMPFFFVFIPSVLGIIFGGIGLASSRRVRGGRGVALAAVIIGVLSVLGGIALYAYLGASGQLNDN